MKDRLIYPCVIYEDNGTYYAEFKDFKGCFTDAESMEQLYLNAKDVLEGTIQVLLKNDLPLPTPNNEKPFLKDKEFLIYIDVWIAPIMDKIKKQTIKKTLTIPKWLNDIAEKQGINFSSLLQTAIKSYLNIE